MVRNDRILGQAVPKETPTELKDIALTKRLVSQIEFFFKAYNEAYGKQFKVLGTGSPKKAKELVKLAEKAARGK